MDPTTANVGAPAARFVTSDVVGFAGLPLVFDATYSTDPENAIASYKWDFGDGSPTGSQQIMAKIYSQAGTYTVTLTITDAESLTDSVTRQVVVLPESDASSFNAYLDYTAKWKLGQEAKDSLKLQAQINVGDTTVGAGSLVACEMAGQRYAGLLDAKLQSRSDTVSWKIKANVRGQPYGTVKIKLKVNKVSGLGLGFMQAGVTQSTEEMDIPVRLEVGGRSVELAVPTEFNVSESKGKGAGSFE